MIRDSRHGIRRLVSLAVGLVTAVVFAVVPQFERPFASPLHEAAYEVVLTVWWAPLLAVTVAVVTLDAARQPDGGLWTYVSRRAWLVPFAVGAGVGVNLGGVAVTGASPSVLFRLAWMLVVAVVIAVVVTTSGVVLGRGARRVVVGRG